MLKKSTFLLFALILSVISYGQNVSIKGVVQNFETTSPIPDATLTLRSISDTTKVIKSTTSNGRGQFAFNGLTIDSFRLTVTSVGFAPVTQNIKADTTGIDVRITLSASANVLAGVTVTATVPMAVQKGDTVQFNASQFKVNPDATAEDLARKMPGITLEGGQVKANGENVQKVTLDGRELFGDDATAALRNLPAEIIDKIQVFDRLSDQAQFTGFDDGSSQKGINIITKANMRNGQFGRVFAGYGTDERYQAGGNATILKDNRRISLIGNFNNVNQQNFASQDLLGVQSGGGGRGGGGPRGGGGGGGGGFGGGGGMGGGGFGGGSNFSVGQQNGINKTNSAGLNYSDNWGKKIVVAGSYFFNSSENTANELVNTQYFSKVFQNTNQNSISSSSNTNHRVNFRMEYKIDSFNQLIITPNISLQKNSSLRNVTTLFTDQETGFLTRKTNTNNSSTTSGANLNNNILYRHSFKKRGRTLSVNLNTSTNTRDGDVYTDYLDTTYLMAGGFTDSLSRRLTDQLSDGYQLGANVTYTEPIGKASQLQLTYRPSYVKSNSDQEAFRYESGSNKYSIFDSLLSNKFENTNFAQNAGIGYRYGNRDNQLSIGVDYQRTELHSDQTFPRALMVDKAFNNVLPNAMARFKLSTNSNVRIFYRSSTNQPSVTQLQNVYNITNRPFVTTGNPQLNQQYGHMVTTRYTYTNPTKGFLFVGNVFLQTASNYITNASYSVLGRDSVISKDLVLKRGEQLTKPVNLDGYMSLRSFLNFAFPLKVIKSNFNLNGGVTYSKLPGVINDQSNISKNLTYNAGAVVASNVSQYVDFTVSYSANMSSVKNQLQPNLNSNYFSHVAGLQLNLLSKSGWFFQNDVNNQLTRGLSEGFNQNFFLWNMAVGKKFLKDQKGELKLSVFDLLKQNRSITRNAPGNYIEDVQSQVLQQYFMLTFTYNLRSFGAGLINNNSRGGGGFGPGGGGGRPPMF